MAIFGLFAALVVPTFAEKNENAQGPHEHTTGNITAVAGSKTLWMEISAHGTNPAKGHIYYINSDSASFRGEADCYIQTGNQAAFSGLILDGTFTGRFLVEVFDNGEIGDKLRVRVGNYDCNESDIFSTFPGLVSEGDIVVHQLPENAQQQQSHQEPSQNGNTNNEQEGNYNEGTEQPLNSGSAIDDKWNLSGTFVAHPGYNWGGLAEGATWNYKLSIKQALDQDNSVGSIHFSTGDIDVVGQVKATKENYFFSTKYQPNIAAVGTATYNDVKYNFMMIYAENVAWLALSESDYSSVWEEGLVWSSSQRAYQLHSLNPIPELLEFDSKDIH